MSALPNDFLHDATRLTEDATRPFPASRKIHVEGSRPDLRVPMREISLTPTRTKDGIEPNAPVTVYDTSGPYTDPAVHINLLKGLAPVRAGWIEERGDTETRYKGMQFLLGHALPNVYFHVSMAYSILRHNGVEVGKRDYLGKI